MSLETATYLDSLITTWPAGSDQRSTADDHFRLIKGTLLRTFPKVAGEVSVSHTELNLVQSASWNIQAQLNAIRGTFAGATVSGTAHYAQSAGDASFLAGISADQYPHYTETASFTRPVVMLAGMAVAGIDLGTLSGTLNIEPSSAGYFGVVLGGNVTDVSIGSALTFGHVFSIRVQQDGAGSNAVSGWPADVVWADNSAFEARATASAVDFLTFVWDATLAVWLASPRRYG